jgi:protein-S-isoprenylcysteine O-methyltransferase Ste14
MTTTKASNTLGWVALITERFVLSIVFFCLGAHELMKAREIWIYEPHTQANLLQAGNHMVLMFTGFFSCPLLLLARRAAVSPSKFKLVFVPLLTTFFSLLYFAIEKLPDTARANLAPATLQTPLLLGGLTLILLGHLIAFWGILFLGRSFGVVVAVRKIVLSGPYRWVRHPMYLGWVIFCAGIAIANFSIAFFIVVTIHIALLVYRARLEESELADFSPEYREYKERTGFIFPRLRG